MNSKETFHDHIKELRNRVSFVILSVALFSTVGYVYRNIIISFIHRPYSSPLYYNTPAGAFNLTVKISLVVGLFFTLPILLFNIIRFIEPALGKKLKKAHLKALLLFSCILAISGAAFAYYVLLPMSLHFFGGFSSKTISPLISASEYFNYVINMVITFAVVFQIPLVVDFINRVKPLKPKQLLKYQKYVIVGAIIIAIALPFTYDPISQFVVAIPIVGLYYLSIILVALTNRRPRSKISETGAYSNELSSEPKIIATENHSEGGWQTSIDELLTDKKVVPLYASSKHDSGGASPTIGGSKYFDVMPANTIQRESMPSFKIAQARPNIKGIKKTRFIDGFRPINNRAEPFST